MDYFCEIIGTVYSAVLLQYQQCRLSRFPWLIFDQFEVPDMNIEI